MEMTSRPPTLRPTTEEHPERHRKQRDTGSRETQEAERHRKQRDTGSSRETQEADRHRKQRDTGSSRGTQGTGTKSNQIKPILPETQKDTKSLPEHKKHNNKLVMLVMQHR